MKKMFSVILGGVVLAAVLGGCGGKAGAGKAEGSDGGREEKGAVWK